ncbi:MAG: ABC transporter permease [Synergistetes bacterium]|nr:ABC transporter permease [Synergistota bacterium]
MRLSKKFILGATILLLISMTSLLAPLIAPYNYCEQNLKKRLALPNKENPFGTDHLGRDLLSRVIWGGRSSVPAAFGGVALSMLIGILIGTIAGYNKGLIDEILMRITDVFLSLPSFILTIAILSASGVSLKSIALAIAITNWPKYARMIRALTLAIKNEEFIVIPSLTGASFIYITLKHLLPNTIQPAIVLASFDFGRKLTWIASFGFLGLGISPPTPEWGSMIKESLPYALAFPHLIIFPTIPIILTKIGSVFLGEGLEEIFSKRRETIEL